MVVEPGDLVVGDEDGVVAVPFDAAARVCELAEEKARHEAATFAAMGHADNNAERYRRELLALGRSFED